MTQNIFMDQVPRRVIVAMVANSAYVGDKKKSPFKFEPFDVREMAITAGGTTYPYAPYSMDFSNGRYARAYHDLQEAVGCANSLESNGISMKRFGSGWTIFCFTLTSTLSNDGGFELIRSGTTALHTKFNRPIPEGGVTVIVYGVSFCDFPPPSIHINVFRNSMDFYSSISTGQ